jgi:gliding motility-associated-like protein
MLRLVQFHYVEDNCPVANDAPSGMLVPNVFTPNNDGANDYFYVKAHSISNFNCNIYNRWGTMVFQYSDVNGKWNGNNQSELPCISGVYFYQITYTNNDNQTVPKTGTILLLR